MNYQLEIDLKSPAHAGSGEGWAGLIDADIVTDSLGLPYIPARRIKGILREMAMDVVAALQKCNWQDRDHLDEAAVLALFGGRGQEESGPLIIENAYLADYPVIKRWLEWANFHFPHLAASDRIIQAFTHLRKQTAISDGVAQPHSLRITRVLNQGYQFIGEVELTHARYEPLLALAVLVTRYLGSKRNRGLGKIQCRLLNAISGEDVTQNIFKNLNDQIMDVKRETADVRREK